MGANDIRRELADIVGIDKVAEYQDYFDDMQSLFDTNGLSVDDVYFDHGDPWGSGKIVFRFNPSVTDLDIAEFIVRHCRPPGSSLFSMTGTFSKSIWCDYVYDIDIPLYETRWDYMAMQPWVVESDYKSWANAETKDTPQLGRIVAPRSEFDTSWEAYLSRLSPREAEEERRTLEEVIEWARAHDDLADV